VAQQVTRNIQTWGGNRGSYIKRKGDKPREYRKLKGQKAYLSQNGWQEEKGESRGGSPKIVHEKHLMLKERGGHSRKEEWEEGTKLNGKK